MGANGEISGEGDQGVSLEVQISQFEDALMVAISRAYEEYDLPQELIWGVLVKVLGRELVFHLGGEFFGEEEGEGEEGEGEEWKTC